MAVTTQLRVDAPSQLQPTIREHRRDDSSYFQMLIARWNDIPWQRASVLGAIPVQTSDLRAFARQSAHEHAIVRSFPGPLYAPASAANAPTGALWAMVTRVATCAEVCEHVIGRPKATRGRSSHPALRRGVDGGY
jgi:hypothetical protein